MRVDVDLFGNELPAEVPFAGSPKPLAGKNPPLSPDSPTSQSVSVKESIFVPYYVVKESPTVCWVVNC
jgi:hypothetical protein